MPCYVCAGRGCGRTIEQRLVENPLGGVVEQSQIRLSHHHTVKPKVHTGNRRRAQAAQVGKCRLAFHYLRWEQAGQLIMRDGSVPPGYPILIRSSSKEPLDRAAVSSIRASNPFEPLPSAFTGPYIELRAIYLYNLPPEILNQQ